MQLQLQLQHNILLSRILYLLLHVAHERMRWWQTETKQLRVRVYHTYVPPVEASEDTQATPGRWTLRIEGVDASAGEPTVVVRGCALGCSLLMQILTVKAV